MTKAYITKRAISLGAEEVTLLEDLDLIVGNYVTYIAADGCRDVVHKKYCFDNYEDAVADCKLKIKARIDSLNNQIKGLEHLLRKIDAGVY